MTLDGAGTVTSASYSVLEVEGEGGGDPTATEETDEVPAGFAIHANYPNPFNPTTTFEYSVERSGRVAITVHDLLGRQVDEIIDGVVAAGTHSVVWDAGDQPSGLYQVRISMDGEVRARSVVLQK